MMIPRSASRRANARAQITIVGLNGGTEFEEPGDRGAGLGPGVRCVSSNAIVFVVEVERSLVCPEGVIVNLFVSDAVSGFLFSPLRWIALAEVEPEPVRIAAARIFEVEPDDRGAIAPGTAVRTSTTRAGGSGTQVGSGGGT
jgi:hypothetical protein